MQPLPNVQFLVDRIHVGASDIDVVRECARRMKDRTVWTRALRRRVYRAALSAHHRNRMLYVAVTSGRLTHR